jgi:hypothetical protein
MQKLLIAACCAALVASVPVASAQTTSATSQGKMKTHNPSDSYAKAKKKSTKSDDSMKDGTSKDSTKK